jgi:hypothetical protein
MSSTWSVSLAPEAMREASAPEAASSSARPRFGDHPLAHGRPFALVLDNLHIAAVAGLLEAEEHGPSQSSTTESDSRPNIKPNYCANVALHFEKTADRSQ